MFYLPILWQPAQYDADSQSSHRGAAKGVQLYAWPAANHTLAGTLLKTLAGYHVGSVFAYLSSLCVVFLSSRGTEKLRQKVEDRTVTEDDLRAWAGSHSQSPTGLPKRDASRLSSGFRSRTPAGRRGVST